uniref:Defensin-like protein 223 n=1 Tax=Arabidopsis thaliana TaxID=3702 RepID=DF223_ARATH|nr:RecName: Full=Defensin-like protein 223; Flags: Precursor [Arabidopsis thaliana]
MKSTIFVLTLLIFVSLYFNIIVYVSFSFIGTSEIVVPSSFKRVEGPVTAASADFCYKCSRGCYRRYRRPVFCQGSICRCSSFIDDGY